MFELISDLAFSRASFSKSDLYGTNSLEGIQTYSICHFRNRTRQLNLRHSGYVPSNHRGFPTYEMRDLKVVEATDALVIRLLDMPHPPVMDLLTLL